MGRCEVSGVGLKRVMRVEDERESLGVKKHI